MRTFSATFLRNLPLSERVVTFMCAKVPGLGIAVYPSGTKRFFYRRRTPDFDTGRIPIGTWSDTRIPDMTIQQATQAVSKLNNLVNQGINPAAERKARKTAPTMGDLYERFLAEHVAIHNKSDLHATSQWNNHLAHLTNKQLTDIDSSLVIDLFTGIVRDGKPYAANRVLSQVRKMFEFAIDIGYWDKANPAARIKPKRMPPRDRKLEDYEFPAFMTALAGYHHRDPRDVIYLAMYTGQRIGAVMAMKWADINLTDKLWLVPASDEKNKKPARLPLSDDAVDLLTRRKDSYTLLDRRVNCRPSQQARTERRRERMLPYVFRSRSKCGHTTQISRAWKEILSIAGIEGLRIHDLRRTFVSLNANNGTDLVVASRLASHSNISTTAEIYTIVDIDPMREAVNRTAANISKLASPDGEKVEQRSNQQNSAEEHCSDEKDVG